MFVRVVLPGTAVLVVIHEAAADIPEGTFLTERKLARRIVDRKNASRERKKKKRERGRERDKKKNKEKESLRQKRNYRYTTAITIYLLREYPGLFPSFFRTDTWTLRRPVAELKRPLGVYVGDRLDGADRFFQQVSARDAFTYIYIYMYMPVHIRSRVRSNATNRISDFDWIKISREDCRAISRRKNKRKRED